VRIRRPHPATVVALFAVAGASQIVAGFGSQPTPLQVIMTVLHTVVAGGAAGWMALTETPEKHGRRRPKSRGAPGGGGAQKKFAQTLLFFSAPKNRARRTTMIVLARAFLAGAEFVAT
jgi:hypothetical protein